MTPWTAAWQASLSITNSQSLLKLMSIKSVMPSNHLILCRALLLQPSISPSIRVFSNESVLRIRWPKDWGKGHKWHLIHSSNQPEPLKKKKMKSFSHVRFFATPWTVRLPGSSIHGIFQARVLGWIAISFSRESSRPRDHTQVSRTAGRHFTI